MKNIMKKVRNLSVKAAVKGAQIKTNAAHIFTETKGEGFVDTAVRHVSN